MLQKSLKNKYQNSFVGQSLALYIHIPFCEHVCHYCDFAKTAHYGVSQVQNYFLFLEESFAAWHQFLGQPTFHSVFVGGGTPSLFTKEYDALFKRLSPYITSDAEVTIETNPKHITSKSLHYWRGLGFNRISLGIQTFDELGLEELTRKHDSHMAEQSLSLAKTVFDNVSVDLIYAWPSQTSESLMLDISKLKNLNPTHVSAYALIYEPTTPLHRRLKRGVIKESSDELQYEFYQILQRSLQSGGFEQYELSNWCKPGFESKHNQTYWRMESYLSLGIGAHGFLKANPKDIGLRYFYPKNTSLKTLNSLEFQQFEIDERVPEDYLQEAVLSGLRHKEGVRMDALTQDFFSQNMLANLQKPFHYQNNHITLDRQEWFRENHWIHQLLSTQK